MPGIRVWKSNFGSVHITISQELTMPKKTPVTSTMSWEYLLAPAIRWPEDLEHQEQPQLDMDLVKLVKDRTEELHQKGYFVTVSHNGIFDMPRRCLRGTEQWLIDLIKDPPFARKLIEFAAKPVMEITNVIIEEAHVDAVHVVGDMGTPNGPFISPRYYKEFIYPWHRKLAESYHKRGAFFFIHSHGYLMPIMGDMVKAGFDAVDPVSPLCGMSLAEMKEKYGDRVTLWADLSCKMESDGKIDTLKYGRVTCGLEPVQSIISLLKYTLKIGAPGGGFILRIATRAFRNEKEKEIFNKVWEKLRCYPIIQTL